MIKMRDAGKQASRIFIEIFSHRGRIAHEKGCFKGIGKKFWNRVS